MPYYKNTNYSLFYALLALMVICCLGIAGRVIRPAVNKLSSSTELRDLERAFEALQHPAGSLSLSRRTANGILTDAEKGCDLFVGEIRQFDGDREEISPVYARQLVSGYPLKVLFLDNGEFPVETGAFLPESLSTLAGWDLPPASTAQPMYLVYLLVVGFEGHLKLNCR